MSEELHDLTPEERRELLRIPTHTMDGARLAEWEREALARQIAKGRALNWRQAFRWAGRQAVTWLLLASGVLGVVVVGMDLAADKWPSWSSVLMTPLWWWWAIRRISADVARDR